MFYYDLLTRVDGNVALLVQQMGNIVAEIDTLNTAVSTLAANFVTLDTAIQAEITLLKTALTTNNTAAILTAATNISKVSAQMAADAAALVASHA